MEDSREKELSFWDHLDVLRSAIIRSLCVLLALLVAALSFKEFIFGKIIMAPLEGMNVDIVNLEISGQFMVHLKTSLIAAVVVGFPYLLWEIWRFVSPALYPSEKGGVRGAFFLGGGLFYAGVAVGYFILLPVCLVFFKSYILSDAIENTFSLQSYMSMFSSMVILMGLVFEFPVLIMILNRIGILPRRILVKGRKYALVIILILAALITPADVWSMIIAALPLYALYELSIFFCKSDKQQNNTLAK